MKTRRVLLAALSACGIAAATVDGAFGENAQSDGWGPE